MAGEKPPYRIEWRPKAREDLRAIIRHIGKDNPSRARSFGDELRAKTEPLARHPELGRAGGPGMPDHVRVLIAHRNYVIFYRVRQGPCIVEIVAVKHAARKMP